MGWHVIGSFQCVFVLWSVLRHQTVENGFHIHTHIRVCVLVDAKSATRMLAEYVDDACLRQLGQLTQYLARYQMETTGFGFKRYLSLLYHFLLNLLQR